jgi:hypothetical protein
VGRFSSLLGKMKESRDELVRRAAKKAADAALDRTKDAARGALDSVSDTIERAIFGNVLKGDADKAPREKKDASEVPDPFAKLKAREREPAPAPPAPTPGAADDDVEAELGALKKRLGK